MRQIPSCLVFILDSQDCCHPDWTKIKAFNTLIVSNMGSVNQFMQVILGSTEVIDGWMQWEQSSPLYASQIVRVLETQAIVTVVLVKVWARSNGFTIPDYTIEIGENWQ